jgi:hypothetical protein
VKLPLTQRRILAVYGRAFPDRGRYADGFPGGTEGDTLIGVKSAISPHFSHSPQGVGSGKAALCVKLRRSASAALVAQTSVCVLLSASPKSKPHRLKPVLLDFRKILVRNAD